MRTYEIGNKSEIASWNNFQEKQSLTLGNWITITIYVKSIDKLMLIILLLFVFEFAVYIKYDD